MKDPYGIHLHSAPRPAVWHPRCRPPVAVAAITPPPAGLLERNVVPQVADLSPLPTFLLRPPAPPNPAYGSASYSFRDFESHIRICQNLRGGGGGQLGRGGGGGCAQPTTITWHSSRGVSGGMGV